MARLRRLNGVENHRGGVGAGVLGDHRDIITLAPDLQLFHRRRTEGIPRRQHHRLTLLFKLTRQLADGSGFPHPVHADHQNNKWRFAFNVQRLVYFGENLAHLFFQQAVQRFRIAQLLTAGAFRQVGNDLAGGFHPDVGDQQLFFQLFKQIIVDLLTAEQADKSGTEILLRFQQATLEAGEEAFFCRFFLLLSQRFKRRLVLGRRHHYRRLFCRFGRQRLRFQLFIA